MAFIRTVRDVAAAVAVFVTSFIDIFIQQLR